MGTVDTWLAEADCLHVWMRPREGFLAARMMITGPGEATETLAVDGPTEGFLPAAWTSPRSGDVQIRWDDAEVDLSLIYAFTPERVIETGIRNLWTSAAMRVDETRYRFHLHPPFGWMNDPNGACEVDGLTHVFYQHNPHARRWSTMHWGHAVSQDGITWSHQPIALLPREELVRKGGGRGGAYSGTARTRPDGTIDLFYTDRDDERRPTPEWQMTAPCRRNDFAGPSEVLLDGHPPVPGFRNDWRDPFVFTGPDGLLKMLLGGADTTHSLVLLYETQDPVGLSGWQFVDVLFRELAPRSIPVECPCIIGLEGTDLWVLIFGLIGSRDEATRRRNLSRVYVGAFDGRTFVARYTRELDFGTDCYAMQVWRASDGPRGIAWAANWTDVSAERDFESAMTTPRRLLWRNEELLTPPIEAVAHLRSGAAVPVVVGQGLALPDGLADIDLVFEPGTPFDLRFRHPTVPVQVTYDGEQLRLSLGATDAVPGPRYEAVVRNLSALRVLLDVGLIEVFADGGRTCCTKRIPSALPFTEVLLALGPGLKASSAWTLRSAE